MKRHEIYERGRQIFLIASTNIVYSVGPKIWKKLQHLNEDVTCSQPHFICNRLSAIQIHIQNEKQRFSVDLVTKLIIELTTFKHSESFFVMNRILFNNLEERGVKLIDELTLQRPTSFLVLSSRQICSVSGINVKQRNARAYFLVVFFLIFAASFLSVLPSSLQSFQNSSPINPFLSALLLAVHLTCSQSLHLHNSYVRSS